MKTVISDPDRAFGSAERAARSHGTSRSQSYAAAADRYAQELESVDATAAIDAVVDLGDADDSARFARAASVRAVTGTDEESWGETPPHHPAGAPSHRGREGRDWRMRG